MGIYDFTVRVQDESKVSLETCKDEVLLIVNTVTGCGFTPQYDEFMINFRIISMTSCTARDWKFWTFPVTGSGDRLRQLGLLENCFSQN